MEQAVGIISGVIRTSSISRPGISDVILEFDWKTDMDFAHAQAELAEAIAQLNMIRKLREKK